LHFQPIDNVQGLGAGIDRRLAADPDSDTTVGGAGDPHTRNAGGESLLDGIATSAVEILGRYRRSCNWRRSGDISTGFLRCGRLPRISGSCAGWCERGSWSTGSRRSRISGGASSGEPDNESAEQSYARRK